MWIEGILPQESDQATHPAVSLITQHGAQRKTIISAGDPLYPHKDILEHLIFQNVYLKIRNLLTEFA